MSKHNVASGDVDDVQRRSQLVMNNGRMTLKPKPNHPNRKRFATIEEISISIKTEAVGDIKSAFQKCLEDWKKRCHKCIIPEEGYFEGDKIVTDK